jgi:hypothetical protein
MSEPSTPYRARFVGRPDLDSASFNDYAGHVQKGVVVMREDEEWRLVDIETAQGEEPDTLVFERIE